MIGALAELTLGLVILSAGGWFLVRGATAIAVLADLPTPVIGLTIVAMGTSLPELAVSLDATGRGSADLAFGNILGSNTFNIAIVLPLAALLRPVPVTRQTVRMEYPFMLTVTVLVLLLGRDLEFDRLEGAFFALLLVGFTAYVIRNSRSALRPEELREFEETVRAHSHLKEKAGRATLANAGHVLVGIAALTTGAHWMVTGGVEIAELLGVSGRIIGLTVIAMGTSLPEAATAVAAAAKRETGLILGNVVGSNLFNLLGILGITSLVFPVTVPPDAVGFDAVAVLVFSVALAPVIYLGTQVRKRDAVLLLLLFGSYLWLLLN